MVDARYWWPHCCSIHPALRSSSGALVGYVYVPLDDPLCDIGAQQYCLYCRALSSGSFHNSTPMYRSQFYSRHVFIVLNVFDNRFFFHEHARKIGIWAWAFVISPYLGPFLSAIISNFKSWRDSFWIDFMIVGLALFFVTFLGDETLYDRDNIDEQPPKPTGYLKYRVQMLTGVYGAKCKGRVTVWQSTKDLFFLLTRPYFACLCGILSPASI